MSGRPAITVLAGVNGAGKSSILGRYLQRHKHFSWYNPDDFARELIARKAISQKEANAGAWQEGVRRLDWALEHGEPHAFETTLGGNTITERLAMARQSHDVFIWYCGLDSPAQHVARVRARVGWGGHDIPEQRIRERFQRSPLNLIRLMPYVAGVRVFDNSAEASESGVIPNPRLLLGMLDGQLFRPAPNDPAQLESIPEWAQPLIEAAFRGAAG